MNKFNVGDVLVYPNNVHPSIAYTVTEINGSRYRLVRSLGDYGSTYDFNTIHVALVLSVPFNPNHITLSSLDYMTSTEITQEDKEIIKEHLEHA